MSFDLECTLVWLVLRPIEYLVDATVQTCKSSFCSKLTVDALRPRGFDDKAKDEDEDEDEDKDLVGRLRGDCDRPDFLDE